MITHEVSRGIPHIEDLPPLEFLSVIRELSNYEITEKLDGSQILFGLDEIGFYTSRETKGGSRIYHESEYGLSFNTTFQRSAHKLLESVLFNLKTGGLSVGDQVEAEALFGGTPNVVPYSENINYIILLRTTGGSVSIDKLANHLHGIANVTLSVPCTDDGISVHIKEHTNMWKFARSPVLTDINLSKNILNLLDTFERYLHGTSGIHMYSNVQIESLPLNKVPDGCYRYNWKLVKEDIKQHRTLVREKCLELMLGIKEELLDCLVRNRPSVFGPSIANGGWIEGVVLRDKSTKKMVKLVDKNVFGVARIETWAVRNNLTEKLRGINSSPSVMGDLYIRLATSLGHAELGTTQSKAYLTKDVVQKIEGTVDINAVSNHWVDLCCLKRQELKQYLDKYIIEGRYTGATDIRTKEVFSSLFDKIDEIENSASRVKNSKELIKLLVGKQLGEI